MLKAADLTSANLRRLIQLEEASAAGAVSASTRQLVEDDDDADAIPIMECLRSPTTRTVLQIIQNRNHYDVIKDFVLDAQQEERETQAMVDEAEAVRAIPLTAVFAAARRDHPEEGIGFSLPRDDAGVVIGVDAESSNILKTWGATTSKKEKKFGAISAAAAGATVAVVVPHGTAIVGETPLPPPPRPAAASKALVQQAVAPPTTVERAGAGDMRSYYQRSFEEQRAEKERMAASRGEYERLLGDFSSWQDRRLAWFDKLVQPSATEGSRASFSKD